MKSGDCESRFTNRSINTCGFWGVIDTIWVIFNRIYVFLFLFLTILSLIIAIVATSKSEPFSVTAKEMFHIR